MSDVKNRKNYRIFVQNIIWHATIINFISIQNQLTMAWNNLN